MTIRVSLCIAATKSMIYCKKARFTDVKEFGLLIEWSHDAQYDFQVTFTNMIIKSDLKWFAWSKSKK